MKSINIITITAICLFWSDLIFTQCNSGINVCDGDAISYEKGAVSNNTAFQVSTFERSAGLNNTGEENGFFGPNTRGNSIGSINSFFGHRSVIDNTFEGSNSFLVQDLQETIFLGVSIF